MPDDNLEFRFVLEEQATAGSQPVAGGPGVVPSAPPPAGGAAPTGAGADVVQTFPPIPEQPVTPTAQPVNPTSPVPLPGPVATTAPGAGTTSTGLPTSPVGQPAPGASVSVAGMEPGAAADLRQGPRSTPVTIVGPLPLPVMIPPEFFLGGGFGGGTGGATGAGQGPAPPRPPAPAKPEKKETIGERVSRIAGGVGRFAQGAGNVVAQAAGNQNFGAVASATQSVAGWVQRRAAKSLAAAKNQQQAAQVGTGGVQASPVAAAIGGGSIATQSPMSVVITGPFPLPVTAEVAAPIAKPVKPVATPATGAVAKPVATPATVSPTAASAAPAASGAASAGAAAEGAASGASVVGAGLAAVASRAAAVVEAFVAVGAAVSMASDAFIARGKEMQKYSGELTAANVQADIRSMLQDIKESQEQGPEIARLTEAQSQASTELRDMLSPIKAWLAGFLADILEDVVKFLRFIHEIGIESKLLFLEMYQSLRRIASILSLDSEQNFVNNRETKEIRQKILDGFKALQDVRHPHDQAADLLEKQMTNLEKQLGFGVPGGIPAPEPMPGPRRPFFNR